MYFGYLILLLLYYHCVASRYKNLYGVFIMKSIPQGISIIYFNDESKIFMRNCRKIENKQNGCQSGSIKTQ